MVLILAFSITPKKFLHDLVADHTDNITIAVNDGHDHIDHRGFNCNCDNLVATSPFTEQHEGIQFHTPVRLNDYFPVYVSGIKSIIHSFFALRGPPALG
ncbi:MAG: hypothetical protein KF746_10690 [Chitinophagaceae bacterium]|nr:hypothetical protein [Chitinophagaceae bacterium]